MVDLTKILKEREGFLEKEPVLKIAGRLGRLSNRWLNKNFVPRRKAVNRLVKESGFSQKMAEAMLGALFRELTEKKLTGLLKSEFRDERVLDGFCREGTRFVRARGPRVITHIFSGNVPNPSVVSFVLGMILKSANIGKVSSRSGGILDIYLESLRAAEPKLARTNYLLAPNDRSGVSSAIRQSELVVAYGDDRTLETLRGQTPAGALFFGYGTKMSAAFYSRSARQVRRSLAGTARDIWMSDQRGCLSPLEIFVEKGGEFAHAFFSLQLLRALEDLYGQKGWSLPAGPSRVLGLGARKITRVRMVKNKRDFLSILRPHRRHLQAVSLETGAGSFEKKTLAEELSRLGVNRLCAAGSMQSPPLDWHHDGFPNIASWVRWTDLE